MHLLDVNECACGLENRIVRLLSPMEPGTSSCRDLRFLLLVLFLQWPVKEQKSKYCIRLFILPSSLPHLASKVYSTLVFFWQNDSCKVKSREENEDISFTNKSTESQNWMLCVVYFRFVEENSLEKQWGNVLVDVIIIWSLTCVGFVRLVDSTLTFL